MLSLPCPSEWRLLKPIAWTQRRACAAGMIGTGLLLAPTPAHPYRPSRVHLMCRFQAWNWSPTYLVEGEHTSIALPPIGPLLIAFQHDCPTPNAQVIVNLTSLG